MPEKGGTACATADGMGTGGRHFTKTKLEHLRWDVRRKALLEVIEELDADIIVLQVASRVPPTSPPCVLCCGGLVARMRARGPHVDPAITSPRTDHRQPCVARLS